VSDAAPRPAPRRPASARPRQDADHQQAPPDRDELEAIERQLAALPTYSGATMQDVPELELAIVRQPGAGPGLNFAA
jgi:hypothetical protein